MNQLNALSNRVEYYGLAHVTNTMGQNAQDFEKGEADGTADAMRILQAILQARQLQL
jgi:hypothetical protein